MIEEENHQHSLADEATEASKEECSWPVLNFNIPAQRIYHFHQQFTTPSNPNNFLKGVKWSPDGSCFLTSSDDNTLRLFVLPENENGFPLDLCSVATEDDSFAANIVMVEGESVYDYCWYPYMSASGASIECF